MSASQQLGKLLLIRIKVAVNVLRLLHHEYGIIAHSLRVGMK